MLAWQPANGLSFSATDRRQRPTMDCSKPCELLLVASSRHGKIDEPEGDPMNKQTLVDQPKLDGHAGNVNYLMSGSFHTEVRGLAFPS